MELLQASFIPLPAKCKYRAGGIYSAAWKLAKNKSDSFTLVMDYFFAENCEMQARKSGGPNKSGGK